MIPNIYLNGMNRHFKVSFDGNAAIDNRLGA
jgi:hypothetical protein